MLRYETERWWTGCPTPVLHTLPLEAYIYSTSMVYSVTLSHRSPSSPLPHQVEDMLKRSFAEFHAQRSAPQVGVVVRVEGGCVKRKRSCAG